MSMSSLFSCLQNLLFDLPLTISSGLKLQVEANDAKHFWVGEAAVHQVFSQINSIVKTDIQPLPLEFYIKKSLRTPKTKLSSEIMKHFGFFNNL